MAEYKKRQSKKVKLNKKRSVRRPAQKPERIQMSHTTKKQTSAPRKTQGESKANRYRVLQNRQLKKRTVWISGAAFLLLVLLVFQLALPTGIIESLQNSYALNATNGSGCDSLMGTSFLQMNARYGRIDLLSGAYYEVYNKKGGTAYTVQHGYSAPVMATSAARTLIFERDGTELSVYNLSKQQQQITVDGKLYTASISRGGKVAVAYKSNDYLSVVEVYTKRSQILFTQNFSNEYVTSLSLNSSGRYLTVATLFAKGGIYHSNLYLFDVKKQKQVLKTAYENMFFTASESLGNGSVLSVSYDKAVIVFPGKKTMEELDIPEKISNYSVSSNNTIAFVCNQTNNTIDNKIRLYNKRGKLKTELDFVGTINGFSVSNTHIYILSDDILHIYRIKDLKHTQEEFPNAQLLAAFRGGAAAISNSKLQITKQ
ncbi:MAG: hypothetical protein IJW78_04950 [Clostridia bacterium]|nr:hypothetical protein [Clostridia bacterium]MBQ7289060.1 hypothetical protein [Clostridia bacterium]